MVDQEDIYKQCQSEDPRERIYAIEQLEDAFPLLQEKQQACDILLRLTNDEHNDVRESAVYTLGNVFSQVPNKQQIWDGLINKTSDEDSAVMSTAAIALGSVFSYMPDIQQIWNEMVKLAFDEENVVRTNIANFLSSAFYLVPDKQLAWVDLHKMTNNKDNWVRSKTVSIIGDAFNIAPDKQQAWDDIHRLTNDKDVLVRSHAVEAIGKVFSQVPNKEQAWKDLHRLTNDDISWVRPRATEVLSLVFSQVPNKKQAWDDLHRLANDNECEVISNAIIGIGSAFSEIPDKMQATNDLFRYLNDEYIVVKSSAIYALGLAFSDLPDKLQAWDKLYELTYDENGLIRKEVAAAFGLAFSDLPDKLRALDYLHGLTNDVDNSARYGAVYALGKAFSDLPDQQQACYDIHRLVDDTDDFVRTGVAFALGSIYTQVQDKQQVWDDLYKLANDENNYVRIAANHALGRFSIFKASIAEEDEDFKKELEKAISFFEIAVQESPQREFNPSYFCLPFYRSFYAIIFNKQEIKDGVVKCLEEAKIAIEGSESKELLFEAVNNLAFALEETSNLENMDLQALKDELGYCMKYCDRAAELMEITIEKAPFATRVLQRGLPILNNTLKDLLKEIQEKAKIACKESQGTPTEDIACTVNREVKEWKIGNQEEMTRYVKNLIFSLKSKIQSIPENKDICDRIDALINEKDITRQYEILPIIISLIPQTIIKTALDPERMTPTIAIITALSKEYAAVRLLLDNKNENYHVAGVGAGRRYCLGEIPYKGENKHSVVLTNAGMGNNIAATKATLLLEHFPNVKSIIMVGIAGGVPNPDKVDDHVRLGDIVVSNEYGVIQYDNIKEEAERIICRNPPRPPCARLLEAVRILEANEILGDRPWDEYIVQSLSQFKINRPSDDKDILYKSYDQGEIMPHPDDSKRIKGLPRIFIGPIASANILLKNAKHRDELREKFGVKAIEMEASGIADATWIHEVGYLVVRGICDYCDSHKNDDWQQYAAIVAAAYTRALIESMP